MSDRIRVGFVGAGENTRVKHIPGFRRIGGVELAGVVNRSRGSSEPVAREFGIPRIFDRWEDLVADPGIDAVCIGTWPCLHCPVTVAALDAGKHVLCEARMAMNADEARRMLDASRRHPGLVAQLVPSPLMMGPDAAIHDTLRSGRLGELLAVDVHFCTGTFIDRVSPMTWRQDARVSGLNAMAMGIVVETLMRWIGPARSVAALSRVFVPRRRGADGAEAEIRVPDHLEILCEFPPDAAGHLRFSAVAGKGPSNAAWLYGSEGTLLADFREQKVVFTARGAESPADLTPPKAGWAGWRVEEEFVGAIRGTEKVRLTTFEDGVRYMDFTEAVARSAAERRTVSLPLA
jgi:predicted dehydrogenase